MLDRSGRANSNMPSVTFQDSYSIKIKKSNYIEDGVETCETSSSTVKFRPYANNAYEMNYNDDSYLLLLKSNSANNKTEFTITAFDNTAPISRGTLIVLNKSTSGEVEQFQFTNTYKASNKDPTITTESVIGY